MERDIHKNTTKVTLECSRVQHWQGGASLGNLENLVGNTIAEKARGTLESGGVICRQTVLSVNCICTHTHPCPRASQDKRREKGVIKAGREIIGSVPLAITRTVAAVLVTQVSVQALTSVERSPIAGRRKERMVGVWVIILS